MKRALALGAFALAMALPLVSSASSITANFNTSSTGTPLVSFGDTIQFDIWVQLDVGTVYPAIGFTVSGDLANTVADNPLTHELTQNRVTSITLNPLFGTSVDWSGGAFQAVAATNCNIDPSGRFGRCSALTNTGALTAANPALIATVTIENTRAGVFLGGATIVPGIDGLGGDTDVTINVFQFSHVPEPDTALLMLLGFAGLGVVGRSKAANPPHRLRERRIDP